MEEVIKKLRLRFENETSVVIEPYPVNWQKYAEWLEKLAAKELNHEILKENQHLKDRMQKLIDVIKEGIAIGHMKHIQDTNVGTVKI